LGCRDLSLGVTSFSRCQKVTNWGFAFAAGAQQVIGSFLTRSWSEPEGLGCVEAAQSWSRSRYQGLEGEPGGRVRRRGQGGRRRGQGTAASSPVSDAGEGVGVLQAGEARLRRGQEAVVFVVLLLLVFLVQAGAGAELEAEALAAAVGQEGRRAGVVLP